MEVWQVMTCDMAWNPLIEGTGEIVHKKWWGMLTGITIALRDTTIGAAISDPRKPAKILGG